ncbi:MAG: PPC domain-containing protein [Planctomycetota bacterium]|jgi:hypothetical protein
MMARFIIVIFATAFLAFAGCGLSVGDSVIGIGVVGGGAAAAGGGGGGGGNDFVPSPTGTGTGTGTDDSHEEDDSFFQADLKGDFIEGTVFDGKLYDDDYYRIYVPAGSERVGILCRFTHAQGDIDIELYDFSQNWLEEATGTKDNEFIDFTVPSAGYYYIIIYTWGTETGQDYILEHLTLTPNTEDMHEEDDDTTEGLARGLTTGEFWWLSTLSDTADVYAIEVLSGFTRVLVDCRFKQWDGDIDIELLDSGGGFLDASYTFTDDEWVDFTVLSPGTYFIRFQPFGSATDIHYSFWWAGYQAGTEDAHENDDDITQAYAQGSFGPRSWFPGTLSDFEDYYLIYPGSPQRIIVDLQYLNGDGDIDLEFTDSSGNPLDGSYFTRNDEWIDYTVNTGDYFYIRVYSADCSSGVHYSLWWNLYDLGDEDCHEEDDTMSEADILGSIIEGRWLFGTLDDSWDIYPIDVPPGQNRIIVECPHIYANGNIDIEIWNNVGTMVAESTLLLDDENMDATLPTAGWHYIALKNVNASPGAHYSLWWASMVP